MSPWVFLLGCIGVRVALAWAAATVSLASLRVMGVGGAAIAGGFALIWLGDLRPVGLESSAPGGRVWWNDLRPVHAALWAAFAWSAWHGAQETAWRALAADVALGLAAWTVHHHS